MASDGAAAKTSAAAGNEDDERSFMTAQELISAHIVSMTLKAAMELGLIDAPGAASSEGRTLTAGELVSRLPAANKAEAEVEVDRMLLFLAGHGVVRCATENADDAVVRRYMPASVCRWLSSKHGEGSLAPLALFGFHKDMLMPWYFPKDRLPVFAQNSGDDLSTFEIWHFGSWSTVCLAP